MDIEAHAYSKPTPGLSPREGSLWLTIFYGIDYFFQDAFCVADDFFISKPQHFIAFIVKIFCAPGILFRLLSLKVMAAVNLNNQPAFQADKIRDISMHRVLSSKMSA